MYETRDRDSQRRKNYKWGFNAFTKLDNASSKTAVNAIVKDCCDVYGIPAPSIRFSTRAKRTAHFHPHKYEIMLHSDLNSWANNIGTIIHEVSHAIMFKSDEYSNKIAWHGAEFTGIMINLLAHIAKMDRAVLMTSARAYRVQYCPQAVNRDADKTVSEPKPVTKLIKRPGAGICKVAWHVFEGLRDAGREYTRKEMIAAAVREGVNSSTASTQYSRWVKYLAQ